MASKMTIYEFAKQIGLSTGTVSRAIHNRPDISPATRTLVLAKMNELGFQPSATARALSTGRSRVVSIWVPGFTGAFATTFLGVMWNQLRTHGYEMGMWDTSTSSHGEEVIQRSPGMIADGIVVLDRTAWVDNLLKKPQHLRFPIVSVGSYCVTTVDHVGIDLSYGAQEAIGHLIKQGSRRVAYLVPVGYNVTGDARYDAYMASATKAEIAPEIICVPDATRIAAMKALTEHIEINGRPDGIFCYNDDCCMAAYKVLRTMGIDVPEDVAIVGCDGIDDIEYLERPLSTIHIPLDEVCKLAWEFLMTRMKYPTMPQQRVVLVPKLVIRESSRR